MKRNVATIILMFILAGLLVACFKVREVRASGAIYIRADGNVDPPSAPIQPNGYTYVLTNNIDSDADGIVIARNGVTLDGANFTIQGAGSGTGINITQGTNVTVTNLNIKAFQRGIYLIRSSGNTFYGNTITGNFDGIALWDSSNYNSIVDNSINTNLGIGIGLSDSSSNNITGNNLARNKEDDIYLNNASDNNISGNTILSSAWTGIGIFGASRNNSILGNHIAGNIAGNTMYNIRLHWSSENSIVGNNITDNVVGIQFDNSSAKNIVHGNNIANNEYGIWFSPSCSENFVHHNNFENNTAYQVYVGYSVNVLDDGYPSGGNYWSNYNGTDLAAGPYQNETSSDGIGDSAYVLDAKNSDHYPLMDRFETFYAGSWNAVPYFVDVISNSTVSDFSFNASQKCVSFNVTGSSSTGFCRATIDNALLEGPYTVWVNTTQLVFTEKSDGTHSFIYFTYNHSIQNVRIVGTSAIPEFPSIMILPLIMVMTLLAAALYPRTILKSKSA